ncbi:MAG: TonB-dependent receptor [Ignavibacteriae bacterium]|nr:TonB-dependent receptor [Ignavibacteriota bacterium]
MRIIFYLLLFFFLTIKLFAQEKRDSIIFTTIDSIEVKASRYSFPLTETPFSIDVINSNSLSKIANPLSLKEALNSNPGLFVNNRYNLSQDDRIILRGIGTRAQFGVRGIKIFLDGIPLTMPDGQTQLNNLDINNIGKVEIVKGPSSVLYGNSLGGAILFESILKNEEVFSIKPELTFGSFGLRKFNLKSQGKFLSSNYTIGAYSAESKGFREHSQAKFYGISFLSKTNISDNIFLSLISNYYNAPYMLNPSTLNKYDSENNPTTVRSSVKTFGTGKKVEQFQNGLNLQFNLNDNSKIKSTLYGVTRSLQNSIPGRIIELERLFAGARIEFENKFDVLNNELFTLTGIDYEAQSDKRKEFVNGGINDYSKFNPSKLFNDIIYKDKIVDQNENVKSLGVFAHLNFKPTELLTLFAGIRFDDYLFEIKDHLVNSNLYKIKMNNFSEMLGFSYKVKNNLTLFGNYSNGFQTPTTNELSNNLSGDNLYNKSLNPEKIDNYEIGFRFWQLAPNIFSTISLYKMDLTDMLVSYESASEETFYRNAASADNIGLEAKIEYQPVNNLEIISSYSFMNFRYENYIITEEVNGIIIQHQLAENYLPGIPKNNLVLSASYDFPFGLTTQLSFTWTDKYFTNDFNGPNSNSESELTNYVNDAYSLFNLNLFYSHQLNFAEIVLKLNIENLFNVRYNDSIVPNAFGNNFFEPASGRAFYFSLSINL